MGGEWKRCVSGRKRCLSLRERCLSRGERCLSLVKRCLSGPERLTRSAIGRYPLRLSSDYTRSRSADTRQSSDYTRLPSAYTHPRSDDTRLIPLLIEPHPLCGLNPRLRNSNKILNTIPHTPKPPPTLRISDPCSETAAHTPNSPSMLRNRRPYSESPLHTPKLHPPSKFTPNPPPFPQNPKNPTIVLPSRTYWEVTNSSSFGRVECMANYQPCRLEGIWTYVF